jgi:hypothetical protein
MIISPTVVKETRAQFGCATLQGAALENEGGQGSANAHWEYRWFQGELMVATNLFAVRARALAMRDIADHVYLAVDPSFTWLCNNHIKSHVINVRASGHFFRLPMSKVAVSCS